HARLRQTPKVRASALPLTAPVASSLPSTQISICAPRLMPATWCQAPSKMLLVEVTLPAAPPSKEKTPLVLPEVPRPYWWVEAVALVSQLPFAVGEELP